MGGGPGGERGLGVRGAGRGLGAVALGGVPFARAQDAALGRVVGDAIAEQRGEAMQGGGESTDESGVDGEVTADLVRVGVELYDSEAERQRGAGRVVVRGEGVRAGDQHGVVRGERAADGVVARRQHPRVQGVRGREVQAVDHRLEVDRRTACLRRAHHRAQGVLATHSVAGDDRGAGGVPQQEGGAFQARGGSQCGCGGAGRDVDLGVLAEQVHGDGEEHRPGGRPYGRREGAAQGEREVAGVLDVVRRLHGGGGQGGQVAREHRVLLEMPAVLLTGRHHERGARAAGVEQADQAVGEAGRDVQAHERGAARAAGVSIRHGDHGALVDAENVFGGLGGGRQRGQEGQFGGAGIAEDPVHALAAQDVQQGEGGAGSHGGLLVGTGTVLPVAARSAWVPPPHEGKCRVSLSDTSAAVPPRQRPPPTRQRPSVNVSPFSAFSTSSAGGVNRSPYRSASTRARATNPGRPPS